MSLQDLGSVGEFIAAIAVLVSLVYLALQIRQNTRSVRAGTHQAMVDGVSALDLALIESSDLARIMVKAHTNYDSLPLEDRIRFEVYASRFFGMWENAFFQHREGLVAGDMWEAWEASYRRFASSPPFVRFWEKEKGRFLADFQEHLEGKLPSP